MVARIVKIGSDVVVIKNDKGAFLKVNKKELDFDYRIGDLVTVEKNGDEIYFLPHSNNIFDDIVSEDASADGFTIVSLIGSILLTLSNLLTIYLLLFGTLPVAFASLGSGAIFMVISSLCRNLAKTRNNRTYRVARNLLYIALAGFVFILVYIVMSWIIAENSLNSR